MCIVVQNMEAISLLQDEVAVAVFTAVGKFNILPSMVKKGVTVLSLKCTRPLGCRIIVTREVIFTSAKENAKSQSIHA